MGKVIHVLPVCKNCGISNWKKDKKGKKFCVFCGHQMHYTNKKEDFKDKMKELLKEKKYEE